MSLIMSLKILDHPISEFKKGDVIVQEGTPSGAVYVLFSGSIEVSLSGQFITGSSKEGDTFGEIASIKSCNHGATVTASEDSQFFIIKDFITHLKQNPDDSIYVMKMFCDRIIKMNQHIVT